MAAHIDREELRLLIREALKEALGSEAPSASRGKAEGRGDRHPSPSPAPPRKGEGNTAFRLDSGVLGEAKVAEIGRGHSRIVVGPEVVVTPLARDRAREMKLEIVRETS